jgi:flagellar protein FliS
MAGGSAAYRKVEVETASPEKLVVMLYNGAIKHVEEGKRAIAAQDLRATHDHLLRAQEIVTELRGALDLTAGEIAFNLDRIYDYLHRLLVQANLKKYAAPLDECLTHLRDLRDTWAEISARPAPGVVPAPATHNAHGNIVVNVAG